MKTNSIYKTSLLTAALLLAAVDIPAEWTVTMGDYTGTETGATHAPDYLFNPGDYTLAAYNTPENITISGTTATITGTPGWLFTSVQDVTVEADTDYDLTATMHQQVRQLIATGTYGAASDVALHFTRITEGDDAGKWTATVRLLGIAGNLQRLTATLTYSNGNPQPTELESDLTSALADFNADKTIPLTLGGTIAETPTEAGVEAVITGWEKIDGGGVDAEM